MTEYIEICADTAGTVLRLTAKLNEPVEAGAELAVMESMKMEISIEAPVTGRVIEFLVEAGSAVEEDALIARFVSSETL